jgi:3-oxoacyl-[acyl-carrier protein] reductase
MDLQLQGKRALVTGASYGLGYACAKALAEEGVSIAICSRDEEKVKGAASQISEQTRMKTVGISADLTKEDDLKRVFTDAEKFLGGIDILVVSTGHPPTYPFSQATDEQWKLGEELVLRPPIVLSRLVLPAMKQQKYGRIIFIGSIFGLEAESSSVVQSTLRTGLNAMAKCIATEVAEEGVTVNVICPGYFETPLVENLALQYANAQKTTRAKVLEDWKKYSPVKRFGKPEDLGALVAFLSSSKAEFITGTTVTIDGGAVRKY